MAFRHHAQINQQILWLNFSNSNKSEIACDLFLKAARESVTLLQIRGNMGIENRLLAKHVVLLHSSRYNGHKGGRSIHNSRIELFWCEHNATVKYIFLETFILSIWE